MRGRVTARASLAAALLATACLIVPVILDLSHRVPNRVEQELASEPPRSTPEAVPIPGAAYLSMSGWSRVHRITLATGDVGRMVGHREIALLVATYDTNPLLDRAELTFRGTSCVYRTPPAARFPNNSLLTFVRGRKCTPLQGLPNGIVDLTVTLNNEAKLAVWTFNQPAAGSGDPGVLFVDRVPDGTGPSRVVRGKAVDTFESGSAPRINLLAYVWQIANGTAWIWWMVSASTVLSLAGGLGFWGVRPASRTRAAEAAVRGIAMFCLVASLGILYAVLVPPFQAADEPNHFVGFGIAIGRPSLANEATRLATLGHFERIQFHPEERFRTSDVGRPGEPWNDGVEPDAAVRGSGVRVLWHAVAPLVGSLPASRLLLALRLINVAVFALTSGAMAALLVLATTTRRPQLLLYPLVLVPAISFFGMHMSNHATLLCAYVVLATGVLLLVLDAPVPATAGVAIGAGWAIALAISRSALPLASFVSCLLLGRLLLGGSNFRTAARFWIGFTAPLVLALLVVDRTYLDTMLRMGLVVLPSGVARIVAAVISRPWLLLIATLPAAALESALTHAWPPVVRILRATRLTVPVVTTTAACVVAALLLLSVVIRFPILLPIEHAQRPAAGEYVRSVLEAGLTILRLRSPDHLTSTTFWAGFGWLETLPRPGLVSALAGATGIVLITLLVRAGRAQAGRRTMWVACAVVGYASCLAAYAVTVILTTPADLHGRYLIGLYVPMLFICWIPVSEVEWGGRLERAVLLCCALASALVHGYCLSVISQRYF